MVQQVIEQPNCMVMSFGPAMAFDTSFMSIESE